ncbi:MAG: Chorismate dehydratase [Verrucomicrobiota bacterium]|jgi:chorismate dehydratase
MSSADNIPKLRMAPPEPPESAELLERRVAREKLNLERQQEQDLEQSLAPFRVGSVDSLNAVPLTRGLEDEIKYAWPSKLAELLRQDELDAALVSIVEVLFTDRYDVLDGIAIASLGEVRSVLLAHRQPLEQIREVFCDPASLTSVALLKVLLAERGLKPEFKPLPAYDAAPTLDAVLLIGDRALDFSMAGYTHQVMDLGAAWSELTGLPFVYAVWALRRIPNAPLRRALREARDFGLDTLDHIINSRTEYTREFRRDYLGWHIHYHLGTDEKRGIARFIALLRKHGFAPVHEPRFVS